MKKKLTPPITKSQWLISPSCHMSVVSVHIYVIFFFIFLSYIYFFLSSLFLSEVSFTAIMHRHHEQRISSSPPSEKNTV